MTSEISTPWMWVADCFRVTWLARFDLMQELWGWLEPYVDDEQEFKPSPTEGTMTMGQWVRKIIR